MKITRRHLQRLIREELRVLKEVHGPKPEGYIETVNVGNDGKTIDDVRNGLKNPGYVDRLMTGNDNFKRPSGKFFIVSLDALGSIDRHHSQEGKDELKKLAAEKGLGGKIMHLDNVLIDSVPSVVVIELS
jgi:hypothetical protein